MKLFTAAAMGALFSLAFASPEWAVKLILICAFGMYVYHKL